VRRGPRGGTGVSPRGGTGVSPRGGTGVSPRGGTACARPGFRGENPTGPSSGVGNGRRYQARNDLREGGRHQAGHPAAPAAPGAASQRASTTKKTQARTRLAPAKGTGIHRSHFVNFAEGPECETRAAPEGVGGYHEQR
jgi:hypothetical protein